MSSGCWWIWRSWAGGDALWDICDLFPVDDDFEPGVIVIDGGGFTGRSGGFGAAGDGGDAEDHSDYSVPILGGGFRYCQWMLAAAGARIFKVYPRVCGGNRGLHRRHERKVGLSPCVRGKLVLISCRKAATRSIPACAGETACPTAAGRSPWVYPRVCGGNLQCPLRPSPAHGPSPRVRGKRPCH